MSRELASRHLKGLAPRAGSLVLEGRVEHLQLVGREISGHGYRRGHLRAAAVRSHPPRIPQVRGRQGHSWLVDGSLIGSRCGEGWPPQTLIKVEREVDFGT